MAMLATLEGAEVTESDDYILGQMFEPNDGLGVELLGVSGWNYAKNKVANAARNALRAKRLFIVPEVIYCDFTPCKDNLAGVLFGMDEQYCNELLGFSLTKSLKKAVSSVSKAVSSSQKKIKKASVNPVSSVKSVARAALKQAKKYSSPTKALQLSLSPTLQTKAIAQTDPTGISKEVINKTYKTAPDVLPSVVAEKSTEKTVKYDPTGYSQKLYKTGKKIINLQDSTSPSGLYDYYKKSRKKAAEQKAAEQKELDHNLIEQQQTATEPQVIYKQVPVSTEYVPVQTEQTGFDWSGLLNWKTVLIVGGVSYFIFGRRGRGGKRR